MVAYQYNTRTRTFTGDSIIGQGFGSETAAGIDFSFGAIPGMGSIVAVTQNDEGTGKIGGFVTVYQVTKPIGWIACSV